MPMRPPVHRPPTFLSTQQVEAQRKAWIDRNRLSSYRRGYGRRWQEASKAYLCAHPLCAECTRQGLVSAAVLVDHIKRHQGDMKLFWDRANWRPLCKSCHDAKTAREVGFAGGGGAVKSPGP